MHSAAERHIDAKMSEIVIESNIKCKSARRTNLFQHPHEYNSGKKFREFESTRQRCRTALGGDARRSP